MRPMTTSAPAPILASPATRRLLVRYVARRVPACDVDDVVQATLCDALASDRAPSAADDLRRWLLSIARFKVVDAHRAAARSAGDDASELPVPAPPVEASSLLRWAERQLPKGTEPTLRWMLREAEGDKLEAIAADEQLPAERVRQRVSRLRRWMRERWALEIAVVAAALLATTGVLRATARRYEAIVPELAVESVSRDARLVGTWHLVSFSPASPLPPVRRAIADRVAPSLVVAFDGRTLAATAAGGGFARTYTATVAGGGLLSAIRASDAQASSATYGWDGEDLLVTIDEGPWAGKARLRRAR